MVYLTKDDYKNLITFLNRTDLKGNESSVHAILIQKISVLAQDKEELKTDEKKEKKSK